MSVHEARPYSAPKHHYRHLKDVPQLTDEEVQALSNVETEYAFRVNDYYLGLVDWDNPEDPLRKLVIPQVAELDDWGELDASREADYTVARGTQHKYPHTALLLVAETCDSYCRYCFRKRLTMRKSDEIAVDVREGIEYIAAHPEITNVLLTGGDPMTLATGRLEKIIGSLREIEHVNIIRIGTKVLAFNPFRFLEDQRLLEMLDRYSTPEKRIYIMSHFSHPREITEPAVKAVNELLTRGVIITNQCPLIHGVNDDSDTLARLYRKLSSIGVPPYYLFQGRPTRGNAIFEVPIVQAWKMFQEALTQVSGLGRRARLAMSHHTGKIEIMGVDERHIFLRYHRAADPADNGRILVCERDDLAVWLDDLTILQDIRLQSEGAGEMLSA